MHVEILQLLLDQGAPRQKWTNSIHLASELGLVQAVELLLDRGADFEHKDNCGRTSLLIASQYGHVEIVELLLERGSDTEHRDSLGRTALFMCCHGWGSIQSADKASGKKFLKNFLFLLERGARLDCQDEYGTTPLEYAFDYACADHESVFLLVQTAEKGTRSVPILRQIIQKFS